jgi:hypothetical protein
MHAMKTCALLAAAVLLASSGPARAQHCAPLYETWLSDVSLEHVEHSLRIHVRFAKEGGAGPKDAYQGYLVAYLARDEAKVPAPPPGDVLDPKVALVLHTQVMRRNEKRDARGPWTWDLDCTIKDEELVDKLIALGNLGEKDREARDLWFYYKDRIRLAVFVPFLEDEKYSVLEGLPKERHECNYEADRALVFQALPYGLQFLVSRSADTNGRVWVRVRSDKPRQQE